MRSASDCGSALPAWGLSSRGCYEGAIYAASRPLGDRIPRPGQAQRCDWCGEWSLRWACRVLRWERADRQLLEMQCADCIAWLTHLRWQEWG